MTSAGKESIIPIDSKMILLVQHLAYMTDLTWALFQSSRVGEGGLWLEMKVGKPPLVDEGEPTGVEKEPTGLASREIVRREPCSCSFLSFFVQRKRQESYLDRSSSKRRVPARGWGGGEIGKTRRLG